MTRRILPGTIADMAIDMDLSIEVMRKVPGDMP